MNETDFLLFIDTNIFIALLIDQKTKEHIDTTAFFRFVEKENITLYTSMIVLSELYFLLKKMFGLSKKRIIIIFIQLIKSRNISIIEEYDLLITLDLFTKHKVAFVDCLISSLKPIQSKKMMVVSYDKDFDKMKIIRKTPRSIVTKTSKKEVRRA